MNQSRRYRNPPVEEALCEFRFTLGPDWDFTIPGKLQAALGDEYSGKPGEQKALQIGLHVEKGKPANLQYEEGLVKVQLATKDGKRMVGVGPNVLSIHMLRPYQDPVNIEQGGWEEFEPRIQIALRAYQKVVKPGGVNRVGVRYINKIAIPAANVRIEEYLKCAYWELEGLPEKYVNFVSRVEYLYEEGMRLVLSCGLLGSSPDWVECLLDLDVIWQSDSPIETNAALEIAQDLHEREGSAFEAIVTDKARELFDAG